MSEEGENPPPKPTMLERGKQVGEMAERASNAAEGASGAFNAIKWVAIAIVTLTIAGGIYGTYKVISAPAKAVGSAAGAVSESVKRSTDKIKQSGSEIMGRLEIATRNQSRLNTLAEKAFKALSNMEPREPSDLKQRVFWRSNFPGHEGRVCQFGVDFGNGELPVLMAIDHEAFATAKALGAKEGRVMRLLITAGEEDIAMRIDWDGERKKWVMKWRATTLKKPVSDAVAEDRILDVLRGAVNSCA